MKTILLVTLMFVLGACASNQNNGNQGSNTQAQNQAERLFEPYGQRF